MFKRDRFKLLNANVYFTNGRIELRKRKNLVFTTLITYVENFSLTLKLDKYSLFFLKNIL